MDDPLNEAQRLQEEMYEVSQIAGDLAYTLQKTRQHPGLALDSIAEIIKDTFSPDELTYLLNKIHSYEENTTSN